MRDVWAVPGARVVDDRVKPGHDGEGEGEGGAAGCPHPAVMRGRDPRICPKRHRHARIRAFMAWGGVAAESDSVL